MESPLNLAHIQRRKADICLHKGQFDRAISCHKKAAELLEEAVGLTSDNKAVESIQLQQDYHQRQQRIIRDKANTATMAARLQQDKGLNLKDMEDAIPGTDTQDGKEPKYEVYKELYDTDSLLQFLQTRALAQAQGDKVPSILHQQTKPRTMDSIVKSASKAPKNDKEIIEELSIHNQHLRNHILQLLKELDEKDQEIHNIQAKMESQSATMKSISSANDESVKTLEGELGDDKDDFYSMSTTLPSLPPLEMPKFDFDKFKDSTDTDQS